MLRLKLHNKGQAIIEYAIILGIVALALGTMQVYIRRGIQAGIKIAADEIGLQKDTVESNLANVTIENSQVRSKTSPLSVEGEDSFTRQVEDFKNGKRTVRVREKNEVLPISEDEDSYSESWGNWRRNK